jgi:hypothetical protein
MDTDMLQAFIYGLEVPILVRGTTEEECAGMVIATSRLLGPVRTWRSK